MGETTVNPKGPEDTIPKALPTLLPNLLGTTNNPAAEFYNKFQRAADDHDRDFVKKYDEDLNSTLIFAGLFSAVASAFITNVQSKLEPDFEEMNHTLLKIVASTALGNVPTGSDAAFPKWNGPDETIVHVQATLYSSLLASLLAAFIAILGKQWLNRYASVERGSVIDRGRQRKRKMDGMITWKFGLVMECLPLMLQAALLLLGYALSNYLFFINRVVASVVIGFTSFGVLFFLLVVSAATSSYNCPFQTPLSLVLHSLIRFDNEHKKYLRRSRKWFGNTISQTKGWWRAMLGSPRLLGGTEIPNGGNSGGHIELRVAGSPEHPPPIFNKEIDWNAHVLDSECIAWMFEMPTEMDVATTISGFIPEIVWYTDTRAVPLERLYDVVLKCFDHSSGRPILKPGLRDRAYLNAKALIHVGIQRRCADDVSEDTAFHSIKDRHQVMGFGHYEGDSDLESTLGILDRVFGIFEPMDWHNFSFTIPHHAWMGHILLYRAWDLCRKGNTVPGYIKKFILHSNKLVPAPPAPIVADCLFIAGLVLGIGLHLDDLLVIDKSSGIGPQVDRIYDGLIKTFSDLNHTTEEINCALEVMGIIGPLVEDSMAQKSYNLFRVIMQAPLSSTYSEQRKWEASRLAMRSTYNREEGLEFASDLEDILAFLDHHFELATRDGQNQEGPIQNALRTLASASTHFDAGPPENFNPTKPSFIRGICHVLQDNRPLRLRMAVLSFLPLVSDKWFSAPNPIMDPDQMKRFCVDWASAVDAIGYEGSPGGAILAVLLQMINSPHWCPHIVADKWKLLEQFASFPNNFQPLTGCINNPGLIDVIRNMGDPAVMALWLAILWYKYEELVPEVQNQLEMVTKEVTRSGEMDLGTCLSAIDSEVERLIDALSAAAAYTHNPHRATANRLKRKKIDKLRQAKDSLVTLT